MRRPSSITWFASAFVVAVGVSLLAGGPLRTSGHRKVVESVVHQAELPAQEVVELPADIDKLTSWINQDIMSARSPDWAHPSQERLKVIERWAKFLRPYNEYLIGTAMGNGPLAMPVRRLLCYTWPDDALVAQLRRHLRAGPEAAVAAARLLHEHRMLNGDDRRQLIMMLDGIEDREAREGMAMSLAEVGITSGVPAARKRLARPLDPLDMEGSLSGLFPVIHVATNLGTRATELIPPMEEKLAELKSLAPDRTAELEAALETLKGGRPPVDSLAVNGSGYLHRLEDSTP